MNDDDEVPGWDAIDRALDPLYHGREPLHVGTIVRWSWGGSDPLDGISAYKVRSPSSHWHFITYGFSELYEKESDDPDESGWGIELSFRLACPVKEKQPDMAVFGFLQNLARYVFKTGNVFGPRHHLDYQGPICGGFRDTDLDALAFRVDPQLKRIRTPHGRLTFLQPVGITHDELNAVRQWDTLKFLRLLARENPLLITDLSRKSILGKPAVARMVQRGVERDGSSMEIACIHQFKWRISRTRPQIAILEMPAGARPSFIGSLSGRILHGHEAIIEGPRKTVRLVPGRKTAWRVKEDMLTLSLTKEFARDLLKVCEQVDANIAKSSAIHFPQKRLRLKFVTDEAHG